MSGKKRASFGIGWAANIFFHCLWAAALCFLYWVVWSGGYFDRAARADAEGVDALCELSGDAISVASQLGRLDFVSISLTILGVALATGALASYFLVRQAVAEAARDEVNERLPGIMSKMEPEIHRIASEFAVPEAREAAVEWLEKNGKGGNDSPDNVMAALDKNDDR